MNSTRSCTNGKASIEDVLQAMDDWGHAKMELKTCYAKCDSSPDYFCYRQAEAERDARERVGKALADFVDARIEALTGAC